ncbi:leucine-rich repeat-containing protein 15 [Periplaneta americana]|uniref:leucine-rich repeat-containing protein 15 n=1 Tax=Periplaneta americana TaxID=6978 RepID=UPI0037E8336D
MRRLLLYNIVVLLASALLANGSDCPSYCKCETGGSSGILAKCSAFGSDQQFGLEIAYLDLSNIPSSAGLQLTNRIFAEVGLRRVSSITIANSALEKIDVNAFHGLHNLNNLNLSGNRLLLLEPDMFANNTHLEKLSLSRNPLENMQANKTSPYSEYFLNIPSLLDLDLSNCNLSNLLPTMFKKLTTVEYINLASNQISDIPNETFAPLLELSEVDLSDNNLRQLRTDMFEHNTEILELNLRNNPLSNLAEVRIESLQTMDLSLCKFTTVDEATFAGFPNVRNLNMSGNSITSVDGNAFKNMQKLQNLDLSSNKLTGPLPDDLFLYNIQIETLKLGNNPEMKNLPETGFKGHFSELYLLDLSMCGLTHLEEDSLKAFNRLAQLYLRGNEIQYIKPGVLNTRIINLDLSENKIVHLDQLSFPPSSSLRNLFLSANPIKKLSPAYFVNTPRLTKLNLKSCELKQLWDVNDSELHTLKVLRYLNVANNNIKNLSLKDFKYIEHVQTLVLTGNPLACDNDLKNLTKKLIENGVALSEATEKKEREEMKNHDALEFTNGKDQLGWRTFLKQVCGKKQNLIDPLPKIDESTNKITDTNPGEDSTEVIEEEEIYFIPTTPDSEDILNYFEEEIHMERVRPTKTNYMWPIIIVSLSAFSIILALVVLAALLLRWTRQKNSYRNKIIKRHNSICNTPRIRRGGSTVYQQLYEDPHTPTTPVMPSKLPEQHAPEQKTYTFPEKETNGIVPTSAAQPANRASYQSSPFHHSNIVPESV